MIRVIFITLLFFSLNLIAKPLNEPHSVGVLKDWKPYYFINDKGKADGYAVEHFEAIAKNIGLKYNYIVVDSWKECLKLFNAGKIDIIPNVGITKSRKHDMLFSEPTDLFSISLFKKEHAEISSNLRDKKVGVVLQNIGNKLIDKQITNNKIIFQTFHQALLALQNDEIDVMCYPKPLMEQILQEKNINDISSFGKPIYEVTRGMAVSLKETHLLEIVNKEILRLKIDGTYVEIYSKWFEEHKDLELSYQELTLIILSFIIVFIVLLFIGIRKKLLITQDDLEKKLDDKENQLLQLQDQKLQDQKILLTQSKIAAIGEMVGNISHQWRQPLSIISTHASGLRFKIKIKKKITNEEIIECAKKVEEQTMYLSKTIDDFRDFFKADTSKVELISIKKIFNKLYELTNNIMSTYNITYVENIDKTISTMLNQNIMIQAFINIYNNSKDAFEEKNIKKKERFFFVDVYLQDKTIVIHLKDSAGGMDNTIEDKIFEPYFTTKHPSIGTGIGLYMTNQIITKQLNGTIKAHNCEFSYKNKDLKGLEFVIKIPLKL